MCPGGNRGGSGRPGGEGDEGEWSVEGRVDGMRPVSPSINI